MHKAFEVVLGTALFVVVTFPSAALAGETADRAAGWIEAMELPVAAHRLREAGVSNEEMKIALTALRENRGVGGERASILSVRLLKAELEVVRERGAMRGFGAFVRERIEAGLRGQELARAVRERRGGERVEAAEEERRPAAARGRTPTRRGSASTGRGGERTRRPTAAPGRSGAGRQVGQRRAVSPGSRGATSRGAERRPVGRRPPADRDDEGSPGRSRRGSTRR
ncbi:MAG: hypothetical protein ACOCVR_04300 [Myxococcota bacterium]